MDYVLIFLTLCTLLWSSRKFGFLPFPTLLIFILFSSQIVFFLMHGKYLDPFSLYDTVNLGGLKEQYDFVQILYLLSAVFSLFSMFFAPKNINLKGVRAEIQLLALKGQKAKPVVKCLPFILIAHFALFLLVTDWQTLWFHSAYLSPLLDDDSVKIIGKALSGIIVRVTIFMFVSSIIGLFLSVQLKLRMSKLVCFFLAAFYFLFFLGEHSRFAVAFPLLFALFFYVVQYRSRNFLIPVLICLSLFTLRSVLIGRDSAEHGFAAIPATVSSFFSVDNTDSLQIIITNALQGIFTVAEGLQVHTSYDTAYKLLAFSPLPSLIDGYDDHIKTSQVRLHLFVPLPGLSEVLLFGAPYLGLMIILYFVFIRVHLGLIERSPVSFLLCNFLIMFSFYHLLAYPLRNSLHFGWIASALAVMTRIFISVRKSEKASSQPVSNQNF